MEDSDSTLARFNRLMRDLENGNTLRNCFRPWELDLLLDFQNCNLEARSRRRLLQRYRKAVQRHMGNGGTRPLKLSEYLARLRRQQAATAGFGP